MLSSWLGREERHRFSLYPMSIKLLCCIFQILRIRLANVYSSTIHAEAAFRDSESATLGGYTVHNHLLFSLIHQPLMFVQATPFLSRSSEALKLLPMILEWAKLSIESRTSHTH